MDSAQRDVAQVDKVRLMLQRHQEQLQAIHELGGRREESTVALLQELMHGIISIVPDSPPVTHLL